MRKLVATIVAAVAVAGAGAAVATQAVPIRDTPAEASFLIPFVEQDNLVKFS